MGALFGGGWHISVPLALLLCACASLDAHENFKKRMQAHVGQSANDPMIEPNRYPDRVAGRRSLPNGNLEIEYRMGRGSACSVFFEVEGKSQKIISWRYEGDRGVCAIAV